MAVDEVGGSVEGDDPLHGRVLRVARRGEARVSGGVRGHEGDLSSRGPAQEDHATGVDTELRSPRAQPPEQALQVRDGFGERVLGGEAVLHVGDGVPGGREGARDVDALALPSPAPAPPVHGHHQRTRPLSEALVDVGPQLTRRRPLEDEVALFGHGRGAGADRVFGQRERKAETVEGDPLRGEGQEAHDRGGDGEPAHEGPAGTAVADEEEGEERDRGREQARLAQGEPRDPHPAREDGSAGEDGGRRGHDREDESGQGAHGSEHNKRQNA